MTAHREILCDKITEQAKLSSSALARDREGLLSAKQSKGPFEGVKTFHVFMVVAITRGHLHL